MSLGVLVYTPVEMNSLVRQAQLALRANHRRNFGLLQEDVAGRVTDSAREGVAATRGLVQHAAGQMVDVDG
ncbi:MAG: hypothetical protein Q8L21_00280 [Candidatus Komeilibacteria bacterium]|nr:hypothetical protein [Candidatus Komeilibacteria bacterium]